jgi:hypothetical protein
VLRYLREDLCYHGLNNGVDEMFVAVLIRKDVQDIILNYIQEVLFFEINAGRFVICAQPLSDKVTTPLRQGCR